MSNNWYPGMPQPANPYAQQQSGNNQAPSRPAQQQSSTGTANPAGYPQPQPQGSSPAPAGYPQPQPQGSSPAPAGYPQQPQGSSPAPAGYPQQPQGSSPAPAGYPQPQPQGSSPAPAGYPQHPQGSSPAPAGYPQPQPQGSANPASGRMGGYSQPVPSAPPMPGDGFNSSGQGGYPQPQPGGSQPAQGGYPHVAAQPYNSNPAPSSSAYPDPMQQHQSHPIYNNQQYQKMQGVAMPPVVNDKPWEKYHVSQDQYDYMASLFLNFDDDDGGTLDSRELTRLARWLNYPHTPQDIRAMFEEMDTDHNGSLSLDEFLRYYMTRKPDPQCLYGMDQRAYNECLMQFHSNDTDHDGFLTPEEFRALSRHQGFAYNDQASDALFMQIDTNRSGTIDLHEFLLHVKNFRCS